MANLKNFLYLIVLVGAASAALIELPRSTRINDILCPNNDVPDDKWIVFEHDTVEKKASILPIAVKAVYSFTAPVGNIIECVRVTDLMNNGKNGKPVITQGGNNFKSVTIEFTSQRGKGLFFSVEIYGGPPTLKI